MPIMSLWSWLEVQAVRRRPMRKAFDEIYRTSAWNYGESVSEPGSTLLQTETIREKLPLLLEELGIRSILDAGCGDLNWMKELRVPLEHYVGIDVVADLVRRNRRQHGSSARTFRVADITRDRLPRMDLVLCRDCLVHFSFADIFAALRNIQRSGSRYLLTTTFTRAQQNADIATGSWRMLNWERPPFCFPRPLRIIDERLTVENGRYDDKSLGLWRIGEIPTASTGRQLA
jgi:SAM-dependent methyltransferase